jgi:hypothetical protein
MLSKAKILTPELKNSEIFSHIVKNEITIKDLLDEKEKRLAHYPKIYHVKIKRY